MLEKQSISTDGIEYSAEFARAFEILEESCDNLFITGKAGTGKSTFLEYFRQKTKKKIAVIAPTGVAALNVKGQTIHSFFKFKFGLLTKQSIKPKRDNKLYRNLDMLIIDEISMVRADVFDAIEYFLRLNGPKHGEPFGGVQICVIGDLYQLPPIVTYSEKEFFYQLYASPFFFNSEAFDLANFGVAELKKIYRQSEGDFIEALNKIRTGDTSNETISFFNKRYGANNDVEAQTPIVLTTTNNIADATNVHKLSQIPTQEFIYEGKLNGQFGLDNEKLPAPQYLKLKVGAQVMFTKNNQMKKWVNGTIGIVTSLSATEITVRVNKNNKSYNYSVEKESWETIRYNYSELNETISEEVIGEYTQYPLIPAWAITIHKSQGKTLDSVIVDLGTGAFAPGQLYVALSRCRTFNNITLRKPITARDVNCDMNVVKFSRDFVG